MQVICSQTVGQYLCAKKNFKLFIWNVKSKFMFLNSDLFESKHSTPDGFEFADKCVAGTTSSANSNSGNTSSGYNSAGNTSSGNGADRGELQCCGEYPARIPYHDQNGGRKCCIDKVYFTGNKKCCGNGNLVSTGGNC